MLKPFHVLLTLSRRGLFVLLVCHLGYAIAGEVDVIDVQISGSGNGLFNISATLEHADTGWDHYANRWDVLDENGKVLGSRELLHPHVNEQPFTRSLQLKIPESVKTVTIQANDSVHELGGKTFSIAVPH